MSIGQYMRDLQVKSGVSYMQLAKDIGITYQSIMSIKDDRVAFASLNLLNRLSKYENRPAKDILFDSIKDDYPCTSTETLHYLCHQYIEGYSFATFNRDIDESHLNKIFFEGYMQKKRRTNSTIYVNSWEYIKKVHYKQFKTKVPYHRDAYAEIFNTEHEYYANVIAWICAQCYSPLISTMTELHIIYTNKTDLYEIGNAEENCPQLKGIKIKFINIDEL